MALAGEKYTIKTQVALLFFPLDNWTLTCMSAREYEVVLMLLVFNNWKLYHIEHSSVDPYHIKYILFRPNLSPHQSHYRYKYLAVDTLYHLRYLPDLHFWRICYSTASPLNNSHSRCGSPFPQSYTQWNSQTQYLRPLATRFQPRFHCHRYFQ